MDPESNYLDLNRRSWNQRVEPHLRSDFYDLDGFLAGKSSLNKIELGLLGDVRGKNILHLQCHFGQDTLSLGRLGARVTGVDLSDVAIGRARALAKQTGVDATFLACDLYDLPEHLDDRFDIVFSSYGTIGWLPDLDRWAAVVARYLKPGGRFVFVEFHPVLWMFDDDFERVAYRYFNSGPIVEEPEGTYADREADIQGACVMWNHGLGEVISSLLRHGLTLASFEEYDYSPYDCFKYTTQIAPGKYVINDLENKIPMVYSLEAVR